MSDHVEINQDANTLILKMFRENVTFYYLQTNFLQHIKTAQAKNHTFDCNKEKFPMKSKSPSKLKRTKNYYETKSLV